MATGWNLHEPRLRHDSGAAAAFDASVMDPLGPIETPSGDPSTDAVGRHPGQESTRQQVAAIAAGCGQAR